MVFSIDDIVKIETFNMGDVVYDKNYIKSKKIYDEYYTEMEYRQKIKELDLGSDYFIYASRSRENSFKNIGWGFIKITYINDFKNVIYFIRKIDIDCLVKEIKGSVSLEYSCNKLKENGYEINRKVLTEIIPIKYKYNNKIVLDRNIFNKFLNGIDSENIDINKTQIFYNNSSVNKHKLTCEHIKRDYYDLKYIINIFKINTIKLIKDIESEKNIGVSYIKVDGLYFFKKDEVEEEYNKFKDSITVSEAVRIMNDIDGSFKNFRFKAMHYSIDIAGTRYGYININRFNKLKNDLISLKTKLNNENITLFEIYLKYNINLLNENYNEEELLKQINVTDEYFKIDEIFDWFKENLKSDFYHRSNFRAKIIAYSEKHKELINDKTILIINNRCFVKKIFLEQQIELLNKSISINELDKIGFTPQKRRDFLDENNINVYKIDFLFPNNLFISISDFEYIKNLRYQRIDLKEILQLINEKVFLGYNFCADEIPQVLKTIGGDFSDGQMYFHKRLFYKKSCINNFIEVIKDNVYTEHVIDVYNIKIKELESIDFKNIHNNYYTNDEFIELLNKNNIDYNEAFVKYFSFNNVKSLLENTNIKYIGFYKRDSFYSKLEVDKAITEAKQYIRKESVEQRYNLELSWSDIDNYKSNNIPLLSNNSAWIKKEFILKIVNNAKLKNELRKCKTLKEVVFTKIKYYKLDESNKHKGNKIPKTIKHLEDFITIGSNNRNNRSNWLQSNESYFILYKLLYNNLNKEIEYMTTEEIEQFFNKMQLIGTTMDSFVLLTKFNNFLYKKHLSAYEINIEDNKEIVAVKPYTSEQYIELLRHLADIGINGEKLKNIYRDWGKSSSLLYVFMHLCLGWRQGDLVMKLPTPNILFLGLGDISGEEFIQWLEQGNNIDDLTAKNICEDVKEMVEAFREKTGKTKEELFCVIPYHLHRGVALLMLINWANRDIVIRLKEKIKNNEIDVISKKYFDYKNYFNAKTETIFMKSYVTKETITKVFIDIFGMDLKKKLDGGFLSTRAVKSFFTLIVEKSEELGLSIGYYVTQRMRSHKARTWREEEPKILSDTTKIYVDKDISKTSVNAFAMGTMSSIRHILLGLVDEEYEYLSRDTQVSMINELDNHIKLDEIEKIYKTLDEKSNLIKSQLHKYLTTNSKRENFLRLLLYGNGRHAYECSENCKCIFKILKNTVKNIKSIEVGCPIHGNKNSNCIIGCPYLLPSRYFIYEFEKEFNQLLDQIIDTKSDFIRDIHIQRFNKLFMPLIKDMMDVWGQEQVKRMLNLKKYEKAKNMLKGDE